MKTFKTRIGKTHLPRFTAALLLALLMAVQLTLPVFGAAFDEVEVQDAPPESGMGSTTDSLEPMAVNDTITVNGLEYKVLTESGTTGTVEVNASQGYIGEDLRAHSPSPAA